MIHDENPELPDTWAYAQLQDVADINPKLDKSAYADDLEVSFVPMPAVEAESAVIDVSETRPFNAVKKGYTPFCKGDVLFAKITPCMENGKMAVVPTVKNNIAFGSTEFHVLRPYDGINAEYIYYFVSSQRFRFDAEHNMTGAVGQRRVPTSYLAEQVIPLAPEKAQNRIVAKIEELFSELDKGIESLKTAREQLKVYRQAVLKHAFEGKLTECWRKKFNVPAWVSTTLGEQLSFLTSGSRGWAKFYVDQGDIFIRAQNLKYDCLALDDVAFVELPDVSEGMRTRVRVGDLLITITGANVTKTGYIKMDLGTAFVSQHVALARPIEDSNTEFLYWYLISEVGGRKQLEEMAYGAGKPGLNLDNIRSVNIDLPSREEQAEIVSRIQEMLSIQESFSCEIKNQMKNVEVLRQSILKNAFSGQLVKQDSNDEPASVLLERIKAEKANQAKTRKPKKRKYVASPKVATG